MKNQINQEVCWDELSATWPKKRFSVDINRDRVAFFNQVDTEEDWDRVKNHVDCLVEDTAPNKLPHLSDAINSLFKVNKKPVEIDHKPQGLDQEELYKKTNDPEISKVFTKIWEVWPRSPDFVERRSNALDAFLAAARALPLPDIEKACITYANAFNDGSSSMVYPRSLKRFVSDHSYVQEWIDKNNNSKLYETEKKQFEVAYSWYPQFQNKQLNKTKDASWVTYWRLVSSEEKLDFLAAVKLYRSQRKSDMIAGDQSEEESAAFTKSFVNFVSEWRQMFNNNRLTEAKGDIFAPHVTAFCKEMGLDVDNIWGEDEISSFFVRVLTYLSGTTGNIKNAIKEGLVRTINLVKEVQENPKKYNNIKNLEKAIKETKDLELDKLTDSLYKKVCELKLLEMPREVKE